MFATLETLSTMARQLPVLPNSQLWKGLDRSIRQLTYTLQGNPTPLHYQQRQRAPMRPKGHPRLQALQQLQGLPAHRSGYLNRGDTAEQRLQGSVPGIGRVSRRSRLGLLPTAQGNHAPPVHRQRHCRGTRCLRVKSAHDELLHDDSISHVRQGIAKLLVDHASLVTLFPRSLMVFMAWKHLRPKSCPSQNCSRPLARKLNAGVNALGQDSVDCSCKLFSALRRVLHSQQGFGHDANVHPKYSGRGGEWQLLILRDVPS